MIYANTTYCFVFDEDGICQKEYTVGHMGVTHKNNMEKLFESKTYTSLGRVLLKPTFFTMKDARKAQEKSAILRKIAFHEEEDCALIATSVATPENCEEILEIMDNIDFFCICVNIEERYVVCDNADDLPQEGLTYIAVHIDYLKYMFEALDCIELFEVGERIYSADIEDVLEFCEGKHSKSVCKMAVL